MGRAIAAGLMAQGDDVWGSTRSGECDLGPAGSVALDLRD